MRSRRPPSHPSHAPQPPDMAPPQGKGKGGKGGDEEPAAEVKVTSVFIPGIEAAVQEFVGKWQVRSGGWGWGGDGGVEGGGAGAGPREG